MKFELYHDKLKDRLCLNSSSNLIRHALKKL